LRKNVVIIVLLIVIIILGFVVVSDNIQNKSLQPPHLIVSEEEWDFGIVKLNEKPTHIFIIENEGDEDLLIERVRSSCGCLKASISSKRISPGKSVELKATFDTTGYRGKVKKDIYIKSNDPGEQGLEKKISVFVEVEHQIEPIISVSQNEWNLGLISQEDKPIFDFIVENKGDEDLIIDKMDIYKNINYNISFPLVIPPGEKYKVTLIYDSTEHKLGEIRETVIIYSNDPIRKAISFRILGYIKEKNKPALSIYPVVANLSLATNLEADAMEKFTIENLGDELIKIVSIKSSVDYLAPLKDDFSLQSQEKQDLQVVLLKDKARQEIEENQVKEYLYLTIAIPINISK